MSLPFVPFVHSYQFTPFIHVLLKSQPWLFFPPVTMTIEEQRTQVVERLRAGRVVPQSLFVELCSLLVVVPAEHRVALVVERRWVVAVGVHGQVGVAVGLVVVFLLPGDTDVILVTAGGYVILMN